MSKPFGCPKCGSLMMQQNFTTCIITTFSEDGDYSSEDEENLGCDDGGYCVECQLEYDPDKWAASK